MHRFFVLALLFMALGTVSAQETEDNVQITDLAVDAEYLDLDENIINSTSVGDEVFEGVAVTNNLPSTATGVKVTITRSSNYPFEYLEHEVSWDNGGTWIYNDPSYNPSTSEWIIGNLPAGAVYKLVVHQRAVETGTAQFTATISGDLPDINASNNQDTANINVTESSEEPEYQVTGAKMVPMQETGASAGLLVAGMFILGAGLVISRR
ncbi:DUF11 domain-containing protein [Methanothermobacter sp.]|uniref:DUF11 domain-containing protein n=1 Tax=Methanothermobacter sp. TaxID=1884223 RepID=UPI003C744A9B